MDAAPKLFTYTRLSLLLTLALALSAPAWGDTPQFSLSTATVSCSGTSCPSPAGGNVDVSSTGTAIAFSIATDYSGDSNNPGQVSWLKVTPLSAPVSTPITLNFSIATTSLGQLPGGSHSAVVSLHATDASGASPATITVTYQGGSGGGSGTLTSSIPTINLPAASGAVVFSNPTITTTSATSITISVGTSTSSCTGVAWLSASITGSSTINNTSPTTLQVKLDASNLPSGFCQGTVTVSPSTGTVLNIPVNFTVGSGSGGTLTASPNPLTLNYSTGGTLPSSTIVLSTTTNIQSVNASVSCGQGWLFVNNSTSVSGVPIAQGLTVSANSNASSLTTGTYTCTIALADATNPGVTLTNVTVNLVVNGGTTSGLTVSPNPITFNAPVAGAQQSTTATVTSHDGGVLTVGATSQNNFLSFQTAGGTIPAGGSANITVFANPAGLSAGTYTGSLTVTVGSQQLSVPVTLVVGGGGGGGGTTTVAPATVNLVYQAGSSPSFSSHPVLAITGPDGVWTTSIAYGSGASGWLGLSTTVGNLPNDRTLTVGAIPTGLAQGNYSATLTITTTGGTASVTVNLAVVAGNIIYTSPGSVVFFYTTGGAVPGSQQVFAGNSDSSLLNYTTTPSDSWVNVVQQTGTTSFTVSVDPTGKTAGVYTSSIVLNEATATNSPSSMPVVLVVNGGGTGSLGPLTFVPTSLSFSSTSGSLPPSQNLSVSANVSSTFTLTTTTSSGGSWLSVSPASGTTNTNLSVSVSPTGLANGTYNGSINFSSNGNNQTVPVTLTVSGSTSGGTVSVACVTSCATTQPNMSFTGQAGAGALPVGALNVTSASGSATVAFTATVTTMSGGNWLSTSIGSSVVNTPFNPLNVNVNVGTGSTALAAGTYTGNIALTPQGGGATVNVSVTLTVTAPPTVTATPTTLNFTYRAGDPNPATQAISVSSGGTATLNFSVTVSPANAWLSATPASGTTPGTVTVSINPTGLAAGNYTGTVTIAGTNGATGTNTTTVNLSVAAPLPTIARVVNGASYQANATSPGEIITLFASDANHPIGPTTPVGLQLDSTGKVATTLGGVQVLINGFACPLTYVSATQVNAVVPYEVAPLVSASVFVKYLGQTSNGVTLNIVTTSPGTFTLSGSGTGPAAALNSNNTVNGPNNPAARGDVVVLYLTGEGQTSPAGVTGKVTTVSSTPPLTPGPLLPIAITIGGQGANYSFAGEAPGLVSGVLQLNVTVPTNVGTGDLALVVSIGGNTTQTGVTISVR
jgi:uncharacterized protein (TIGR03437 family)